MFSLLEQKHPDLVVFMVLVQLQLLTLEMPSVVLFSRWS
jgi:hypothetical protein